MAVKFRSAVLVGAALLLSGAGGALGDATGAGPDVAPVPVPAPSAHHFLGGVYSTEAECASGQATDPSADPAPSVAYLTREGLRAGVFRCDFVTLHGARNSQSFIATAICDRNGEETPETIMVRNETTDEMPARAVRVVYRRDFSEMIFFRCGETK